MRCFWAEGKNGSFAFRDNQDDQNPGGTYEAAYRAHYGKQPVLGSRQQLAKEAFPPEEYLAPQTLVEMAKTDQLDFLALSEQDAFVGFMVVKTYKDLTYLFFLAIDPTCRSRGYGSRAIETLKAEYPGKKQVVDFEMLDDQAQNKEQRKRRRDFYLRNGYRETGVFLSYLGVDYEVFCMDRSFQEDDFKEMMKTIHIKGFSPHYFHK